MTDFFRTCATIKLKFIQSFKIKWAIFLSLTHAHLYMYIYLMFKYFYNPPLLKNCKIFIFCAFHYLWSIKAWAKYLSTETELWGIWDNWVLCNLYCQFVTKKIIKKINSRTNKEVGEEVMLLLHAFLNFRNK